MTEDEAVEAVARQGLSDLETDLLRTKSQLARMVEMVEKRGHKVLFGNFTMRDGSKSTVYIEWERPEVKTVHEVTHANADQAKQIAELHAVIEYCLTHLEHATEPGSKEHSYIESHVAIRLRDVLNREVASTYVGGLKRIIDRLREREKKLQGLLAEVMSDGNDIGLPLDLADKITEALPRQERLDGIAEIPGKEANRPTQGGGAGGFNDPGK